MVHIIGKDEEERKWSILLKVLLFNIEDKRDRKSDSYSG